MGAVGSLEMDATPLWASGVLLVVSDFQLLWTGHSHHLPSLPLAHGLTCSSRAMLVWCPGPADAFCRSWGLCTVRGLHRPGSVLGWAGQDHLHEVSHGDTIGEVGARL